MNNSDNSCVEIKKRGRKPSNKKKGYFYEEQEQAFIDYIQSKDQNFRDKIFQEKLFPAFTKMIESIIRRYGLFTPTEDFSDTFYDTMSFLITKVNNYDYTKCKKAYSYCGTVCKNYLLLKRDTAMKKITRNISYDNVFNDNNQDNRIDNDDLQMINFHTELINNTVNNIENILNTENVSENEVKVGYALIEMLTNWEDIFKRMETKKFNKSSVLFFIKETTNLDTKEVREAMQRYKKLYFFTKQKLITE